MDNVIESYLVELGFDLDTRSENIAKASLAGFDKSVTGTAGNISKTLSTVQSGIVKSIGKSLDLTKTQTSLFSAGVVAAEKSTAGLVKNIFTFQAGAVGALAAVSGAFIGLADNVAQGDLELQISAQRMMLALPVARQFTSAMNALGVSFDQLAASPELQARFRQLLADSAQMEKSFGPDYEQQLVKIRDIRQQFTRLQQEANYLAMGVVSDVLKDLGTGPDEIEKRLQGFAEYVRDHLPEISQAVSNDLVPILKETGVVFGDLAHMGEDAFGIIQHLIGLITGDSELKNGPVTFDSISKSILHVVDAVDSLIKGIDDVEQGFLNLAKAGEALLHGNFKGAADELKAAFSHFNPVSGGLIGSVVGTGSGAAFGTIAGGVLGSAAGPVGTAAGAAIGGSVGSFVGGISGSLEGYVAGKVKEIVADHKPASDSAEKNIALIEDVGHQLGLDNLATSIGLAVARVESSLHQFDRRGNVLMPHVANSHAKGLFQIEPALAKDLGINASDPTENVVGGLKHLVDLMQHYKGDERLALEAYYSGQGAVDRSLKHGADLPEARAYADRVMKAQASNPELPSIDPGANSSMPYIDMSKIDISKLVPNASLPAPNVDMSKMSTNAAAQYQSAPYASARPYQDAAAAASTTKVQQTTTTGDIHVSITQPGATHEQIHAAVQAGVSDALHRQTADTLQQVQGIY